jgi:hypothetical protein
MGPSQNTSTALAAYDVLGDPPVRLAIVARTEGGMLHPGLGSNNSPSPAWLEGASSAELEDGFHPQKLEEEAGRRPVREVELRLSSPSTPARMMKILEAEGGAEVAARLASPPNQTCGHRLG